MALSSVSGFLQILINWAVGQNLPSTSLNLPQSGSGSTLGKKISFSTGGLGAGLANEFVLQFVTIAPGGSATIDLTNLTDINQYTGVSLARLKSMFLWLLSANDDATNGTQASSVTIGNAGVNGHPLFLDNIGWTFTLQNGQAIGTARPDAAGVPVNAGSRLVKFVNNDLVKSACVLAAFHGATS